MPASAAKKKSKSPPAPKPAPSSTALPLVRGALNPHALDLRQVRTVKLRDDGRALPDDSREHSAVLYPDFGLVFPRIRPIEVSDNYQDKGAASTAAREFKLFGQNCDQADLREQLVMIDYGKRWPAVNRDLFPEMPDSGCLWTATPHPSLSGAAFVVFLNGGYVASYDRGYSGLVLPVLRVGSAASQ